ncbi:MAG: hypothetical protein PHV23_05750 [Candidatus Gracilibacteria bacterium]|nr:hypothetical protein [Candidatus Gracilibacteria bacterium]
MTEIIKRLQIILQLISIGDTDLIETQIYKVDNSNDEEIKKIISFLKKTNYLEVEKLINNYLSKNGGIILFEDNEILNIKEEILKLETEITNLETSKIEMEKIINNFEIRHNKELGNIIIKILKLREDKYKKINTENQSDENFNIYEEAKKDYEEYKGNYEKIKDEKTFILNEDEKNKIKTNFRKACHLCHPDKFKDEEKESAQKIFIDLKNAYEDNDIKKVNEIYESLLNGKLDKNNKQENNIKKEELIIKLNSLRDKKQELLTEIIKIEISDTYKEIISINDFDKYFEKQKKLLEKELKKLK